MFQEIKDVKEEVEKVLSVNIASRCDDDVLYYLLAKNIVKGFDTISAADLLLNRKKMGLPSRESVRRTRQKFQELGLYLPPDGRKSRMKIAEQMKEQIINYDLSSQRLFNFG